MIKYELEKENAMVLFFSRLKEKDRRHYAYLEANKLGYGGKRYIGRLLKISQKTIRKGESESNNQKLYDEIAIGKQRRPGGGRVFFCPTT
jgi:hypothetical protein